MGLGLELRVSVRARTRVRVRTRLGLGLRLGLGSGVGIGCAVDLALAESVERQQRYPRLHRQTDKAETALAVAFLLAVVRVDLLPDAAGAERDLVRVRLRLLALARP